MLVGVILYAFLNARREDAGQIPDPVDNPPDDAARAAVTRTRAGARATACGRGTGSRTPAAA